MARKRLGEILVEAGYLDEGQLQRALAQQKQLGGRIGALLVQSGAISEDRVVECLSRQHGLPMARFPQNPSAEVLAAVPVEVCDRFGVFPLALQRDQKGEILTLAMTDPTQIEVIDTIQFRSGRRVVPTIAGETAVQSAVRRHYYGELPRAEVAAQSPVQFSGVEIDLSDVNPDETTRLPVLPPLMPAAKPAAQLQPLPRTVSEDIPVVTGVLSAPTPYAAVPSAPPPSMFGAAGGMLGGDDDSDTIPLAPSPGPSVAPIAAPPAEPPPHASTVVLEDVVLELDASSIVVEPVTLIRPAVQMAPSLLAAPKAELLPKTGKIDVDEVMPPPNLMPPPSALPPTAAVPPGSIAAKPTVFEVPSTFCLDCGADRVAGAKFCGICGKSFTGAVRAKGAPALAAKPRAANGAGTTNGTNGAHAPSASGAASVGELTFAEIERLEGVRWTNGRPRASSASDVDDSAQVGAAPGANTLANAPFASGYDSIPVVLAQAAAADDPQLLALGDANPGRVLRPMQVPLAALHAHTAAGADVDDPRRFLADAPTLEARVQAPSLANSWRDAAERPIPRKDNRTDVAVVPRARELVMPTVVDTPEVAPAPPQEPVAAYTPAAVPTKPAPVAAPWAAFASPAPDKNEK